MKRREPTKLMRVPLSIYSALKMMSAVKFKPMTLILNNLVAPELKKHGLEIERIANSVPVTPLTTEKEAQENVNG